ncbi:BTAD domain-containing putative transcriptional regulator [Leifsonia sp. F6_8S_P_1B]|uniref:BTAD domain-containing putative transcriptional regulator n=1 Tax=Leifsonia williamsii TaxID=3035919 RepID=A0ABT8KFV2_9MICO|nr:BTAD domain-containing putative transcriptional regulator [Leifsonia williamsii]MDN4615883.1 BTAD domain-containing putative transcriptional regulator [Leifsonia williamsii]
MESAPSSSDAVPSDAVPSDAVLGIATPRVAVLGPVLVEDRAGRLAEPTGTLGKSLIVALVLARGAASVASLVADLWDDAPPRQERAALQTLVSRLRTTAADGLLRSTPGGYALAVTADATDLGLARLHRDRSRASLGAGDAPEAAQEATEGLALWRGEPGAELGGSPLADELARTAADLREELLLVRARARVAAGDPESALADLRPLVAARPLDEQLRAEWMRTLARAGRRSEALLAFAEIKEALLDRLGTRPGPELVALNARLLSEEEPGGTVLGADGPAAIASDETGSVDSTADDASAHDASAHDASAHDASAHDASAHDASAAGTVATPAAPSRRLRIGLRSAPNPLLGRDGDLAAVEELLTTSRLVTVLGAGGLGKTRLALEVGHRASALPAVVVVELAGVRSGDDLDLAFATTLGIREQRSGRAAEPGAQLDLRSRILGLLSERETLLVVDNCEHIVDAAAAYVADILDSTSTVRVLATSRAPLAIGAEQVYPLAPLASADDGPAVQLFMQRARAARPGVVLQPEVVARLCDRLDGLPLAIELAAARARSLAVEEIERRLGDRFALLTGGERTAPERHRTLLAVIDWSWNLLDRSQQALLRRLSIFPDGFSAEAAEAMEAAEAGQAHPDILDDLDALVAQSLVTVSEDPETGILRYRMLETVREFGDRELERAGETALARDGMDAWARAFATAAIERMHGRDLVPTFARVTSEQDNLLAVLRSALESGRPGVVAHVYAVLSYYWSLRSAHSEVLAFGGPVMDALRGWEPDAADRDAAAVCFTVIGGTFLYADLRTSARAISRLKRLQRTSAFGDPRLEAIAALVASAGNVDAGMAVLARLSDSPQPELAVMGCLLSTQLKENAGELDEALATAERAYGLGLRSEDAWATASAAQALAQLYSQLARPVEALVWAERAHDGLRLLGAAGDLRQLDWLIAVNAIGTGDLERGRALLEGYLDAEIDRTGFDYVDFYGTAYSGLAEIALAEGDLAGGIRLYGQAVGVFTDEATAEREALAAPWLTILGAAHLAVLIRAHHELPDAVDWTQTDDTARRLRTRLLVNSRLNPAYLDKPVVGAGLLGYAVWMLDPRTVAEHASASAGRRDWLSLGLELFALAGQANSRQDLASLDRATLSARVREAWGAERLEAAIASVSGLGRDAAAVRGLELLAAARG